MSLLTQTRPYKHFVTLQTEQLHIIRSAVQNAVDKNSVFRTVIKDQIISENHIAKNGCFAGRQMQRGAAFGELLQLSDRIKDPVYGILCGNRILQIISNIVVNRIQIR